MHPLTARPRVLPRPPAGRSMQFCVGGVTSALAVEMREARQQHFTKEFAGVPAEFEQLPSGSSEHQAGMFGKLIGVQATIGELPPCH